MPLEFSTNLAATKSVATGAPLTLVVAVDGGKSPYSYVWKKGGVVISGQTSASATISATAVAGDAATYTCEVTDDANTKITSVACVVTVA